MRFNVAWDYRALHVFYDLPMHSATLVDRALVRFAEHGEGEIRRVPSYFRLRAGLFDVALTVDVEAQTITVIDVFRR